MGYKAGPPPPEAGAAEQPSVVEQPAGSETRSLPKQCHIQPFTEEGTLEEDNLIDCKNVESKTETKGSSISETQSTVSGSLPCPFQASVSEPACPAGKTQKVDVLLAGLSEPEMSKEQGDDWKHVKEDDMGDNEKTEPEPGEFTVSVSVEPAKRELKQDEENVEVVEDEKEEEDGSEKRPDELVDSAGLLPPSTMTTATQLEGAYMWSLELLIAAALCATRDALYPPALVAQTPCPSSHHGMEILGELAELEIKQRSREIKEKETEGEEMLTFDLHSLATLAAARALEIGGGMVYAEPDQQCPIRKRLNLRRKCSWTPRHEPVCSVKGSMETMGEEELAMRVQLAELQRRYKEKQKELAKLQRKHDHQKDETSRSPARRGPGRPRKRKSTLGPAAAESSKRPRSGLHILEQKNRKIVSNHSFNSLSVAQMKARCKQRGRSSSLSSRLARRVTQMKQKATTQQDAPTVSGLHSSEEDPSKNHCRQRAKDQQDLVPDDTVKKKRGRKPKVVMGIKPNRAHHRDRRDTSNGREEKSCSETSEHEEEVGSDNSEDETGDFKITSSSKETPANSAGTFTFTAQSSKLHANLKSRSKRPGLGSFTCVEQRSALRRPHFSNLDRGHPDHMQAAKASFPSWGVPSTSCNFGDSHSKHQTLTGARRLIKDNEGKISAGQSLRGKGHGVSRLLQSFAADEGFRLDEESSFSDAEDEDDRLKVKLSSHLPPNMPSKIPALPNCVLSKEMLVDGLKILISKEDELLYAASVQTLDLPDIFSVVIEGERGNRPRIYSLEQLLQEAVLDVRPQTEAILTEGTRVCAYWSERSRCLYPGYIHRGNLSEEEKAKEGSVMVEFDDGDRGRISLANIRLLPSGYQIRCAEPSPALLMSPGHRGRRTSTTEKKDTLTEKLANEEAGGKTLEKRPVGRPKKMYSVAKAANTSTSATDSVTKGSTSFLNWSIPRKRPPVDFFLFNGTSRKTQKKIRERDLGLFHQPALHPLAPPTPIKSIFGTVFEVDSFSSIANGYSSFGHGGASGAGRSATTTGSIALQDSPCSSSVTMATAAEIRKPLSERDRKHFLVKLDHEGVTSPKTKSGKALLRFGGAGARGVKSQASAGGLLQYIQPSLLGKNDKKVGEESESARPRSDTLPKGVPPLSKDVLSASLGLKGGDYILDYPSDCPSSYSELDEDDEEEGQAVRRRRATISSHRGGRFLSRPSICLSSSSSSSSSSGSISSSSLCSSDNDSSYSSDEDSSSVLLQRALLQQDKQKNRQNVNSSLRSPDPTTSNPTSATTNGYITKAGVVIGGSKVRADRVGDRKEYISKGSMMVNNRMTKMQLKRKESVSNDHHQTQSSLVSQQLKPASKDSAATKKQRMSSPEPLQKIASLLPGRQLWKWSGNPTQRRGLKGKARKLFYKAIMRGKEMVRVGDCAVFLSPGRPQLPYVGRVESLWESWSSSMVVRVKWFYHPEETRLGKRHRDGKNALYQSSHEDENDVQTISHRCQVVSKAEYDHLMRERKPGCPSNDLFYLAGTYEPTTGQLVSAEGMVILS